jgi:UDP-N-acetylmuramoylalanine--D-glutamate ligase
VTLVAQALEGKRVLVVGAGRSGIAAAQLCARLGARVTVTDRQPEAALGAQLAGLPAGVVRELGGHQRESFLKAQLIVLSPGVPPLPEVEAAREAKVPITGELELAAGLVRAPMVAITGTNGKSTTTTLCGQMLAATGHPTFVGGNLGTPLAEAVGSPAAERGFVVVEASSFQLETAERFRPRVGVLLNITPDHLDRYADVEAYTAAKLRLFAAQGPEDFAVLNVDDARVASLSARLKGELVPFSTRTGRAPGPQVERAGWVEGGELCLRLPDGQERGQRSVERYEVSSPGLVGRHNLENALAASLSARLLGATAEEVRTVLQTFEPLPHRMIQVGDLDGVRYYDDSKGTNVGAVVAALDGFPRPVVLIAGGRDKGGSYEPLARSLRKVGRAVVVIGEAADRIAGALAEAAPDLPVERAGSLGDAVVAARRLAHPGDAVVLSPACSSFDMFRNYAERGDAFREAVDGLAERPGDRS